MEVKMHHIEEGVVKNFKEWQELENETIRLSEDLRKKSDNSFVKLIMEIIRRDSEKHKIMQQFVIDSFTKEAMHLAPQDLIPLADVLEKHIKAEARSMGLANACIAGTKNFFASFVASALISDEVKHHEMLTMLDQIKGQVYPYGIVRPG
jgi:hypothetical protein